MTISSLTAPTPEQVAALTRKQISTVIGVWNAKLTDEGDGVREAALGQLDRIMAEDAMEPGFETGPVAVVRDAATAHLDGVWPLSAALLYVALAFDHRGALEPAEFDAVVAPWAAVADQVSTAPPTPAPASKLDLDVLTPTQSLVMEVLSARTRLGESLWTFYAPDARRLAVLNRAAEVLSDLGLISLMRGVTEHTFRARLTELGRTEYLSPTYRTPLMDQAELAASRLSRLRERHVERTGFCLADGAPWPCADSKIIGPAPDDEA